MASMAMLVITRWYMNLGIDSGGMELMDALENQSEVSFHQIPYLRWWTPRICIHFETKSPAKIEM